MNNTFPLIIITFKFKLKAKEIIELFNLEKEYEEFKRYLKSIVQMLIHKFSEKVP